MKKALIGMAIAGLMSSGIAYGAGTAQDNTGCGLGTMIFGENDSILLQIFAVTTNGTLGNQTFGITSGTSDCKQPSKIVNNERLKEFVVTNADTLAKDIASGRGEALDTFAELIDLPAANRAATYSVLQANFTKIFTSEKVEAAEIIDNIATILNS